MIDRDDVNDWSTLALVNPEFH